ncbi:hypothetical protein [Mycolicibacterium hodleri]|uniref:Alanine and proline rich membrane protein n=1 Tax=Mycolicibacterium hodleri TaxID=49897 RepID=A0A502EBB1_9MYCO|nr:hypothetical protein [Mycolicibacterium hodleri]TPG34677.1 hypothetical protein EAH80_12020 [Mycolicibacterium hodleri]
MADDTKDVADEAEVSPSPSREHSAVSRVPQKVTVGRSPVAIAALAIAVIAAGLAAWALLKGTPETTATNQLTGDSKTRVCNVFATVSNAVSIQTHADLGPDPVAEKAVAGNARLALVGGGEYLLNSVDSGTPRELADPVRKFAYNLQDIGLNALAEVPYSDPIQAARLRDGEASRLQIADLCK